MVLLQPQVLGWQGGGDQAEMLSALDYYNAGFISEVHMLGATRKV